MILISASPIRSCSSQERFALAISDSPQCLCVVRAAADLPVLSANGPLKVSEHNAITAGVPFDTAMRLIIRFYADR